MATYAIVKADGREYRMAKGDLLDLDLKRDVKEGDKFTLEQVLLVSKEGKVKVGAPNVKGAKVEVEVVESLKKGPKVRGMVRGLHSSKRRRYGHRQKYTTVRVLSVK